MNKLPDKPSELILVALHDLELCENDENYKIEMYSWHDPQLSRCAVCFAGAVMAKSLDADVSDRLTPGGYCRDDQEIRHKLLALNEFRKGNVHSASYHIDLNIADDTKLDRTINDYEKNPLAFKEDMTNLAFDLWEAGY